MPGDTRRIRDWGLAAVFCLLPAAGAAQSTVFVDSAIGSSSCANYSPATRACGGGTASAYRTIAGAAAVAGPGTTVEIRGGTYRERVAPTRSGTAAQPIVFRRYGSEEPIVTGVSDAAVLLARLEYVVIDGLTVTDVVGWARFEDSQHVTLRNNTFRRATASGTTGGVKLVRSSLNRILDNVLEDGNDNMVLVDAADNNLIQGNTFSTGRHSLLSVRCSSYNVFRSNRFANPTQKAIEIYDCEGVGSDSPYRLDATKRNLFELNQVTQTLASSADYRYNAIQHGAQQTIVRQNVFRHNDGGGVNYQLYSDESLAVYGNRLYNNTFYANRCYAIIGATGTSQYRDNLVKNNLLYRNVSCSGAAAQTNIRDTRAVVLTNNAIETAAPGFQDEAANDFRLAAGSRMIDAGAALTNATTAGSGTRLAVQDASYFYDGYGIAGEAGDTIQLIGQAEVAVVLSIDYAANTLVLDRPLTWTAGQGVALRYSGMAPDMGAFEFAAATGTPPSAPVNLRIVR